MSNITSKHNSKTMTPVSPQTYRGIIFVQIDQLPEDQRMQLIEWLPETNKITIKAEGKLIDRCITYRDYTIWFQNYYSPFGELDNQL